MIKGWDQGVATMKKGEKAVLICRADYAYGDRGSPPKIPGGAKLHFEVSKQSWADVETPSHVKLWCCLRHFEAHQAHPDQHTPCILRKHN